MRQVKTTTRVTQAHLSAKHASLRWKARGVASGLDHFERTFDRRDPSREARSFQSAGAAVTRATDLVSRWKELEGALAGAPATLAAVRARLLAMGFTVVTEGANAAALVHGLFKVQLETAHLGPHRAVNIAMKGPFADTASVLFDGVMVPAPLVATMRRHFDETLSAFERALAQLGSGPLPIDFEGLKKFYKAQTKEKEATSRAAEAAAIDALLAPLTKKLKTLRAAGRAPKRIILDFDGGDGVCKSTIGRRILEAIAAAGYADASLSFKAPSKGDQQQHWLWRFLHLGVPAVDWIVTLWDRGPSGDTVYGRKSAADAKRMAQELQAVAAELEDHSTLIIKLHFVIDPKLQAKVFGKRLARQVAADRLQAELKRRGELTPEIIGSLDEIRAKTGRGDLRALGESRIVHALFRRFSRFTSTPVVDTTDVFAAWPEIVAHVNAAIDAFTLRRAA